MGLGVSRKTLLTRDSSLRLLFAVWGVAHLAFGIAGAAFPRWFFGAVPPWPPLHVGQIQIAGIFDLAMATAFLMAAADVARYAPLMIAVGIVAEWGHALVRIGHIVAGDDPPADLGWGRPSSCWSSEGSWQSRRRSGAIVSSSRLGPAGRAACCTASVAAQQYACLKNY